MLIDRHDNTVVCQRNNEPSQKTASTLVSYKGYVSESLHNNVILHKLKTALFPHVLADKICQLLI